MVLKQRRAAIRMNLSIYCKISSCGNKEFFMVKGLLSIASLFIVIVIGHIVIVAQTDMKAPIANKVPRVLKIHGYEVTDNYFWLRGDKDKLDPAIRSYLEDNNKYTQSFMG